MDLTLFKCFNCLISEVFEVVVGFGVFPLVVIPLVYLLLSCFFFLTRLRKPFPLAFCVLTGRVPIKTFFLIWIARVPNKLLPASPLTESLQFWWTFNKLFLLFTFLVVFVFPNTLRIVIDFFVIPIFHMFIISGIVFLL